MEHTRKHKLEHWKHNLETIQNILETIWNNIVYWEFREDFIYVTLAYEDGQQIGAHKVILLSSSPLDRKMGINK